MSSQNKRRRSLVVRSAAVSEALESRRLLAAVAWTGAGDGVNFSSAANWSTNVVPGSADDVTISIAANPTINVNGSFSFNSLTSDEALSMTGSNSLSLAAASQVNAAFSLSGSATLTGAGTVTMAGATTWSGTSIMRGSGKTVFAPTAVVSISPASGTQVFINDTRVIENSGTINWTSGRIYLDTAADNTPFVNKPTGVMNLNGAQGFGNQIGSRTFLNQGTVNKLGTGTFPMTVQKPDSVQQQRGRERRRRRVQRQRGRYDVRHDDGNGRRAPVLVQLHARRRIRAERQWRHHPLWHWRDALGADRRRRPSSTARCCSTARPARSWAAAARGRSMGA
jgi:hypothetical protein